MKLARNRSGENARIIYATFRFTLFFFYIEIWSTTRSVMRNVAVQPVIGDGRIVEDTPHIEGAGTVNGSDTAYGIVCFHSALLALL